MYLGSVCGKIKQYTFLLAYIHNNLIANVYDVYIFNCLYLSVNGAVQDFEMQFSPLTYPALAEMEMWNMSFNCLALVDMNLPVVTNKLFSRQL